MRVAIFGTGYVGLVTGTCLAEVGHDVVCVDVDAAKVDGLDNGVVPIYEPGLEPMVRANHAEGRLRFTTDAAMAVEHARVVFIAVGTPPDEDGSADLQYVLAVARTIGEHMSRPLVVVDKSTVPVGTAGKVRAAIATTLAGLQRRDHAVHLVVDGAALGWRHARQGLLPEHPAVDPLHDVEGGADDALVLAQRMHARDREAFAPERFQHANPGSPMPHAALQSASAVPGGLDPLLLNAIAVALVGGISLHGGRGGPVSVLVGALQQAKRIFGHVAV